MAPFAIYVQTKPNLRFEKQNCFLAVHALEKLDKNGFRVKYLTTLSGDGGMVVVVVGCKDLS